MPKIFRLCFTNSWVDLWKLKFTSGARFLWFFDVLPSTVITDSALSSVLPSKFFCWLIPSSNAIAKRSASWAFLKHFIVHVLDEGIHNEALSLFSKLAFCGQSCKYLPKLSAWFVASLVLAEKRVSGEGSIPRLGKCLIAYTFNFWLCCCWYNHVREFIS